MKLLRRHPGKPKTRRLLLCAALLVPALARAAGPPNLLRAEDFRHYVDALNQSDPEDVNGGIPNAEAWAWMTRNIPFLSCPDSHLELTYYYRWWAYRKHIEKTGAGYVITEFLRPQSPAGPAHRRGPLAAQPALPGRLRGLLAALRRRRRIAGALSPVQRMALRRALRPRSEERRGGKECRTR